MTVLPPLTDQVTLLARVWLSLPPAKSLIHVGVREFRVNRRQIDLVRPMHKVCDDVQGISG